MKRFLIVILTFLILISCAACEKAAEYDPDGTVLGMLQEKYPDAAITKNGELYEMVSENIDLGTVERSKSYGETDVISFSSMDEFLMSGNPMNTIIFLGSKTGDNRQYIPINANTGDVEGLFYTHSKVNVEKVFYGDVENGDVITFKEWYAVFNGEAGYQSVEVCQPTDNGKYLYILSKGDETSLYGDAAYYQLGVWLGHIPIDYYSKIDPAEIPEEYKQIQIAYDLYEKFVINNDTALDPQKELEKIERYNARVYGTAEPTAQQKALVNEQLEKYGNKAQTSAEPETSVKE